MTDIRDTTSDRDALAEVRTALQRREPLTTHQMDVLLDATSPLRDRAVVGRAHAPIQALVERWAWAGPPSWKASELLAAALDLAAVADHERAVAAAVGERIANAIADRAHEDMYVQEPGCVSIGWAESIARAVATGDREDNHSLPVHTSILGEVPVVVHDGSLADCSACNAVATGGDTHPEKENDQP